MCVGVLGERETERREHRAPTKHHHGFHCAGVCVCVQPYKQNNNNNNINKARTKLQEENAQRVATQAKRHHKGTDMHKHTGDDNRKGKEEKKRDCGAHAAGVAYPTTTRSSNYTRALCCTRSYNATKKTKERAVARLEPTKKP